MTSAKPIEIHGTGVPHLRWAFLFIIGGFLLGDAVWIYRMLNAQAEVRLIAEQMATTPELAYQLSHNIDKKRRLLEAHIIGVHGADREAVEAELANVDSGIADTLRAYEPIARERNQYNSCAPPHASPSRTS
jgi:hypothetical protein